MRRRLPAHEGYAYAHLLVLLLLLCCVGAAILGFIILVWHLAGRQP